MEDYMSTRRKLLFIFFVLPLLIFSHNLSAQETKFVVGVEQLDYMPYYKIKDGDYYGYARELFDAFGKYSGYNFKYEPMPVKRLYNLFLKKEIDFKFPDRPNWQMEKKETVDIHYSKKVAKFIDGVMVLPKNKNTGVESLNLLGTVRGFTPWIYLDRIESGEIKLTKFDSFVTLLKMVKTERIDGAYINPLVAAYHSRKNDMNKSHSLVFNRNLPYNKSAYLLSTIKHPGIIKEFNRFLNEKQSFIDELKVKYGLNEIQ